MGSGSGKPAAHSNAISTFKAAFDGGTRPNRFIVTGDIGSQGPLPNPLLVKATSMPVQTLGVMPVPFRGRVAKLPGDRAYAEWTITLLDEARESNARQKFEAWHEKFNTHKENITEQSVISGLGDEYTTWTVTQLDMQGNELTGRTIRLFNCWPVEVGAIDLTYDSADSLTEYTVTLAYDYIERATNTGNAAGGGNTPAANSPDTGGVGDAHGEGGYQFT